MNSKRKNYTMVLNTSLLCFALASGQAVFAQNNVNTSQKGAVQARRTAVIAKGVVTDDSQDPLPGVSVRVRGTKLATVTDINGKFSLTMPVMEPGKAYYLEFTYLGMEKKVVRYHNSNSINVSMIPAATSQLKEVEVVETGYGRLPRKDMVGAFTTLKGEDVLMPAYQTIDQMLQGKVAGLMVVNSSSRVGSAPKLTIRGKATILGNTDPLWVVDGVIQEDPISIDATAAMTTDMKEFIEQIKGATHEAFTRADDGPDLISMIQHIRTESPRRRPRGARAQNRNQAGHHLLQNPQHHDRLFSEKRKRGIRHG